MGNVGKGPKEEEEDEEEEEKVFPRNVWEKEY